MDKTLSEEKEAKECGATASIILLKSLDNNGFFQADKLALTVAHVGWAPLSTCNDSVVLIVACSDTRVLLTSTNTGRVTPMTENHHADARVESIRLRRMMGGLTTDSFGEVRLGFNAIRCCLQRLIHVACAGGWAPSQIHAVWVTSNSSLSALPPNPMCGT